MSDNIPVRNLLKTTGDKITELSNIIKSKNDWKPEEIMEAANLVQMFKNQVDQIEIFPGHEDTDDMIYKREELSKDLGTLCQMFKNIAEQMIHPPPQKGPIIEEIVEEFAKQNVRRKKGRKYKNIKDFNERSVLAGDEEQQRLENRRDALDKKRGVCFLFNVIISFIHHN